MRKSLAVAGLIDVLGVSSDQLCCERGVSDTRLALEKCSNSKTGKFIGKI